MLDAPDQGRPLFFAERFGPVGHPDCAELFADFRGTEEAFSRYPTGPAPNAALKALNRLLVDAPAVGRLALSLSDRYIFSGMFFAWVKRGHGQPPRFRFLGTVLEDTDSAGDGQAVLSPKQGIPIRVILRGVELLQHQFSCEAPR